MKFHCGPSLAERAIKRVKRLEQWHGWFAWYPMRVDSRTCIWLETIERKGVRSYGYGGPSWVWTYRYDGQEFCV